MSRLPSTKRRAGKAFAETILPFRRRKQTSIILANHGTVSYGESVERAYWWTEILDAYCNMLMMAKRPGQDQLLQRREGTRTTRTEAELGLGATRGTPRSMKDCDICANDIFRESWQDSGVERRAFDAPPAMGPSASAASSNGADRPRCPDPARSPTV